ncbi:MAG TPA: 3',5'-nucleoside bisphosphate phosphatase [Burkholderiaceae bacterium]|nr:3',5'-nucleoside bisphosphate phosphatase [Burkholderiaceae bacterium]
MAFLHDLNADLHAHSTVSDGTLEPAALVRRAAEKGVELFALTDHDELGGLEIAIGAAATAGLRFVPGVEVSVTYAEQTVHIVGLGIDPASDVLKKGLADVRSGRMRRAEEMAAGLAALGIEGALEGALAYAGNVDLVSRTHFARWLVATGHCADVREVFNKYLVAGKPGYVPHRWARLSEAIAWINGAGGVAVVAHPGRYKFSDTEAWALFSEFKEAGGTAIEVATSNHTADQVKRYAKVAREFDLEASRGSDFHDPAESHAELGRVCRLPDSLRPVWHRFV